MLETCSLPCKAYFTFIKTKHMHTLLEYTAEHGTWSHGTIKVPNYFRIKRLTPAEGNWERLSGGDSV
jgi:hypothetical protein